MAKVEGPPVHLDQYGLDLASFGPVIGSILYPKSEDDARKAYEILRGKSDKFVVYRRGRLRQPFILMTIRVQAILSWSRLGLIL